MTGTEPMFDPPSRVAAADVPPATAAQAALAHRSAGAATQTRAELGDGAPNARARQEEGKPPAGPGPRVIGLDLSIASTGYADNHTGTIQTRTIRTKADDYGPSHTETRRRFGAVIASILNGLSAAPWPALVAVEGPSYSSKGNTLHQLAGLWWLVFDVLTEARLPVAVIPPSTVKSYATGKGNATKPDMRVALLKRADIDQRDDNQVDAWWLAAAALDHLGHPPVPVPKTHRQALAKVAWPNPQNGALNQ